LPAAKDTTVSRFATHAGEPGVIYAANSRGLFRSGDAGRNWKLWTSLGQATGLQMAWRRLPAFRSDMERRSAVMSLWRAKWNPRPPVTGQRPLLRRTNNWYYRCG